MRQRSKRFNPYRSISLIQDVAEDAVEVFNETYGVLLSAQVIGYDLRHAIDHGQHRHSMMDFFNDLEGETETFLDQTEGAFETDRRINGRLSVVYCNETSLTKCSKKSW